MWSILSKIHLCVTLSLIVILLLRVGLKRYMTPKAIYMLWGLIVLQLIVPYRVVFEAKEIPVNVVKDVEIQYQLEDSKVGFESLPDLPHKPVQWPRIIWLIGLSIGMLTYWSLYLREICRHKNLEDGHEKWQKLLDELCLEHNIKFKPKISQSNTTPYVFGLLKPWIVVPKTFDYDETTMRHILLHEIMHIKSKDLLMKSGFMLMTMFMWFNPIAWLALKLFEEDQEFKCDYKVLQVLSKKEVKSYGYALLQCSEKKSNVPFAFSNCWLKKKQIGRRIQMITMFRQLPMFNKIVALGCALVATLTFTFFSPSVITQAQTLDKDITIDSGDEVETPEVIIDLSALQQEDTKKIELSNSDDVIFQYPLEEMIITSPYGERTHPILKKTKLHTGADIRGDFGTDIYAIADGEVVSVGVLEAYGNTVIIDHGNGIESVYAQCNELLVEAGDSVVRGQLVATVGTSGLSTGPHLHFEIRDNGEAIDPIEFLETKVE